MNKVILTIVGSSLMTLGCTTTHEEKQTNPTDEYIIELAKQYDALNEQKVLPSSMHANAQEFRPYGHNRSLADFAEVLAIQLRSNYLGSFHNLSIVPSGFVLMDQSLEDSNQLGNQLAELCSTQLHQFGLNVVEPNLNSVLSQSNTALKRAPFEFKNVSHVLTGTLIMRKQGVEVNAKIVNAKTKLSESTANIFVPMYILHDAGISL